MAFTVSNVVLGVSQGNQLMNVYRITADAATGIINTGMKNLNFVMIQPQTGASMPCAQVDADASGVASQGVVGISATSNANVFYLIAYGN